MNTKRALCRVKGRSSSRKRGVHEECCVRFVSCSAPYDTSACRFFDRGRQINSRRRRCRCQGRQRRSWGRRAKPASGPWRPLYVHARGPPITTTTAADQAQTFQFGPITLSRSDDLKRTLIFFRQCKLGASLRRVWPRRRRSRRDGSCDNRSRSQERCTWPSGRYWVTTQDRGFGGRMRGALSVTDPRLWL